MILEERVQEVSLDCQEHQATMEGLATRVLMDKRVNPGQHLSRKRENEDYQESKASLVFQVFKALQVNQVFPD